jgi:hypothetical protein
VRIPDFARHIATVLATAAGIIGFGLIWDGLSGPSHADVFTGIPLLFFALWWVGRDLARSNLAARRRRMLKVEGSRFKVQG